MNRFQSCKPESSTVVLLVFLILFGCGGSESGQTSRASTSSKPGSEIEDTSSTAQKTASQSNLFRKFLARNHKHVKYLSGTVAGVKVRMALIFEPMESKAEAGLTESHRDQAVFGYYYYESQIKPLALSGAYLPSTRTLSLAEINISDHEGLGYDLQSPIAGSNFEGKFTSASLPSPRALPSDTLSSSGTEGNNLSINYSGTWQMGGKKHRFVLYTDNNAEPWLSTWRIKDHGVLFVIGSDGEPRVSKSWDGTGMAYAAYKQLHFIQVKDHLYLFSESNATTHSWTGCPVFLFQSVSIKKNGQIELNFEYQSKDFCHLDYTIHEDSIIVKEAKDSKCFTNQDSESAAFNKYMCRIGPPGHSGTFFPMP